MSTTQKTLTKVVDFEQREVSFREMEVLPELLQTRDGTDKRVARAYSRAMADGSVFPPVVAFRTPDGRLLLADGFTRVDARKQLGFRNVRTVIRPGTIEQAILFGLEANFNPDNVREVTMDDRRHAVKLMLRNEEFRAWSDCEVSKRCGVKPNTVCRIRLELSKTETVPIPEKVLCFSAGKPTGKTRRYRVSMSGKNGLPPMHKHHRRGNQMQATFNGKRVSLSGSHAEAQDELAVMVARKDATNATLRFCNSFRCWLTRRGIEVCAPPRRGFSGLTINGVLVIPVADADLNAIFRAVGLAVLSRLESAVLRRVIAVGYFGSIAGIGGAAVDLARRLPEPIEFMTPEELVAEFGPKGSPAEDDAAPGGGADGDPAGDDLTDSDL